MKQYSSGGQFLNVNIQMDNNEYYEISNKTNLIFNPKEIDETYDKICNIEFWIEKNGYNQKFFTFRIDKNDDWIHRIDYRELTRLNLFNVEPKQLISSYIQQTWFKKKR